MGESQILEAVEKMYTGRGWVFFRGLRTGTGFGRGCEQELDAWAISTWSSSGEKSRNTFEVKVSRSDFLAEIRAPVKRKLGLMFSNFFYFAAPKGIIKAGDLPPECGLIEVEDGKAQRVVDAPRRDSYPPPWQFVASICRRVSSDEQQMAKQVVARMADMA